MGKQKIDNMSDEQNKKLMALDHQFATANQDRLTQMAPEMGLDALSWETIQNSGQLQAALDLEPGRVRVKIAGPRPILEGPAAKNNGYDGRWVYLRPDKTVRGLKQNPPYQVRKSR